MSAVASPPAFVLVHGWAGSAEAWGPVVAELSRDLRPDSVVAVRLSGSPGAHSDSSCTVGAAAEQVVEVVSNLGRPVVLVGHSMGAQVTLLAAAASPQWVIGEVVIDPAYGASDDALASMAAWADEIDARGHDALDDFFSSATGQLTPATVRRRVGDDLRATPAAALAQYLRSEYVDPDAIGLASATRAAAARRVRPVLSLHSSEAGAAFEESLPAPRGSVVERWPGHSHYLHLEDPRRLVAAIDRWVATISAEPSVVS